MRRFVALVAVAIGLALVGACGGKSGTPTKAPTSGYNRSPETSATTPSEEATTPSEGGATPTGTESPPPLAFGQSFTYSNGLQVTVSKPRPYQLSDPSLGTKFTNNVSFTITIVNGTGVNYDGTGFLTTAQSANTEAEEIFDSANGVEGPPSTTLLPGRESEFKIAYGVVNPKDIVLEVTPGFDYGSIIFTT